MSNHTTFYKKLVDSHTVTRIDDQNVLLYARSYVRLSVCGLYLRNDGKPCFLRSH